MSNYLLIFRGRLEPESPAAQEAAWATWFDSLGTAIVDRGHRVGRFTTIGAQAPTHVGTGPDPVTGYVLIQAESLEAAAEMVKACPILQAGGHVEVGETVT